MKNNINKRKKKLLIIGAILLVAAIAWAASELSGQSNAMAQDAGSNSAELEMITLDTLKKPSKQPPPCDWQKEKSLRHEIEENDKQYKPLVEKAKSEMNSSGKVSDATQKKVMGQANAYKELQDQYAAMWSECNCKTRANLATNLGNTRIKSADVVVSEIDQDKLNEMSAAQEELRLARREYVNEAAEKDELSKEDKRDIQANVIPQTNKLLGTMQAFVQQVFGLMNEVQEAASQVSSAKSGGITSIFGSAKSLLSTGPALFKKVQTLSTVSKSMLTNTQDLMSDAQTLSDTN
jgi:hypothetical protein